MTDPCTTGESWSYQIERVGNTRSFGHRVWDDSPRAVAESLTQETRVFHSWNGPVTVWVWPTRDDEHYRMPIPEDAHRFDYGAVPVAPDKSCKCPPEFTGHNGPCT